MNFLKKIILFQTSSKFLYPGKVVCRCGSYFCEILRNIRDGFWCVGKICFFLLSMIALMIADPNYGFSRNDLFLSDVQTLGMLFLLLCAAIFWLTKICQSAAAEGDARLPYGWLIGYIMGGVVFYFRGAEAITQISSDGIWLLLRLYLYPYIGITVNIIAAGSWHDLLANKLWHEHLATKQQYENALAEKQALLAEKAMLLDQINELVKSRINDTIKEATNEADSQNDLSGEKPIG